MIDNRTRITRVLSALIVAAVMPVPVARMSSDVPRPAAEPHAGGRTRATSLQLPMRFDPGPDRSAGGADFIARGPNYAVYLSGTEATLLLAPSSGAATTPAAISMQLVGGNRHVAGPAGLEPLPGITNYLVGNDPRLWKTGIHGYRKVQYRDVYPGVNLIYYGNQRQLEYDFVVAPGARPGDIALAFAGARDVAVDADGSLAIKTEGGTLRQPRPVMYQDVNGARQPIDGGFVIKKGGRVAFRVGRYDPRLPLVIDPVLSYSTYLGGAGGDAAMGVAVDAEGSIYLAGETASLDFPHPNGAQPAYGGSLDAFVAKMNAAGDQLVYATYLGGSSYEYAKDIAVDAGGNAYVTGSTTSKNFPILHARQSTLSGFSDGFVTKLDATGVVVYSTYLGGWAEDYAYGIAVDTMGRAYVTGQTISSDFPTVGALQPGLGGGIASKSTNGGQSWSGLSSLIATSTTAFAIDPVNPAVVYAGTEHGVAASVDGGQTWIDGPNFGVPVRALAIDPTSTSTVYAAADGFLVRTRDRAANWMPVGLFGASVTSLVIDPTAPRTIYAGATNYSSRGVSKSVDGGDHWTDIGMGANVWSLGLSRSSPSTIYAGTDFGVYKTTTSGAAWAPTYPSLKSRVWALAVDPTDPLIAYAGADNGLFKTTTGGDQWLQVFGDWISAIVIPASAPNMVYVGVVSGGVVVSSDRGLTWTYRGSAGPVYTLAVDPVVPTTLYRGGVAQQDAFVARFSPDGSALEYSTFLGGTGFDYGNAIAVDSTGSAYVVGATGSVDLPVLNPLQATFGGIRDLFVAKISPAGALTYATYLGGSAWEDGGSIAVDASGQAHVAGYTLSSNFPTAQAYQPTFGGGYYEAFVAMLSSAGNSFVYSTFLGGSGSEMGPGAYIVGRDPVVSIAVTPAGEAFVTGATSSTNFPTLRALQPSHGGGEYDAFVARFSAGGLLQWSTFLGGTGADFGKRIALDPAGAVIVAGYTSSSNFPTRNPLQPGNAGSDDAFVARIVVEALSDSAPPTTTIALSGSEGLPGWYRSSVLVTLAATDQVDGSGVAFVDYKIGDGAFERYANPFTVSAEGATTVTARATDNAGNAESVPASVLMKIDSTPPSATIALSGSAGLAGWHTSSVVVTLAATDQVDGSGVAFVDYKIGDAPFVRYASPFTVSAEGVTTVTARATDNAGNVEVVPPSVLMKIDTAAPVLTLDAPAERDYLHSETLTLSFSAADEVSGLASGGASGTLDGAPAANLQRIELLTLPLGAHTFVASASDIAGNGSQRSVTFHVVATIQSVVAAVNAFVTQGSIDRATQKDLLAKLAQAQTSLDRGKLADVGHKLSDFITLCKKRVPAVPASVLIADAQYVLGTL